MYAIVNKYNEFATDDRVNPANTPILFQNEEDAKNYLVNTIWDECGYGIMKCDVR